MAGRITIKQLRIERFRGIGSLLWHPAQGLNLILGAADSGKSTVLEAIGWLFSAAPSYGLSDFDYHERKVGMGFSIQAVIAFGDISHLTQEGFPSPPIRGWANEALTDLPENGAEPVIVCRLTGTTDQEPVYEIIGADDEHRVPFSRALRQRISIARLGLGDRGDRDLRLVQGGALDHYLRGHNVRQTVMQEVMKTAIHDQLGEPPKKALLDISDGFAKRNLPHPVRLGLVGTPGVSIAASVGLTVGKNDEEALPLNVWGAGTRRLAALEISGLGIAPNAIAVIDEPETGLEPYRQRVFIRDLSITPDRQSFVTSHSPAVLSEVSKIKGRVWRMNDLPPLPKEQDLCPTGDGNPGEKADPSHFLIPIMGDDALALVAKEPEALFAKLPIVCEGVTEVGFATRLLESRFGEGFSCRGVYCIDAGGHYRALPISKALQSVGYTIAAIADDEGKLKGGWKEVEKTSILLRWDDGACLEAAVLSALPDAMLLQVPQWVDTVSHRNEVHQLAEIRSALGLEKGMTSKEMFDAVGRERFLSAVLTKACPKPEGDRKPRGWFKTFEGGYLLADKLLSVVPPTPLVQKIEDFLTKIEKVTVG